jgi:hypothetical protein
MQMKKIVTAACAFIVIGLSAWYMFSPSADRVEPARSMVVRQPAIDARGAALASEIGRLRRAQQPASALRRGRDPFRFATIAPRPAPPPIAIPVAAAPPPPQRPPYKLIGVAEDTAAGNPVRTAIISGPNQLYVVKEGDKVPPRYGVARISADVVELVDTSDSSALRLALK